MLCQSTVNNVDAPFATRFTRVNSVNRRPKKWQCQLPETLVGDYLIIPLTSVKMVKSEGYRMNTCCRDYVDQCAEGTYSLFSIRRRSGERLATLGLACREGHWRFDWCLGPERSEVLEEIRAYLDEDGELQEELYATDLYYIAHEVARLMNSVGWQNHPH